MLSGRQRAAGSLVAAVAAAGLAGCAQPPYQFVTSDKNDMVMKLPTSWVELDKKKVDSAATGQDGEPGWVVYFDAASRPDPAHARSDSVDAPVLTARSISLTEEQAAELTDDQMRDFLTPVTETAQTQFKLSQISGGAPDPKITTMQNRTIRTRTARGVHVVVGYDLGSGEEVFEKVVLTNKDKSRLHLLLVHCSTRCFGRRSEEIEAVADSFTVKSS
jgi:type IV pilus biogenesis protein CpaD/CtpE